MILISHVARGRSVTEALRRQKMPPKAKQSKKTKPDKKKEFVWTDDEALLLLTVAKDYKIKHLVEGTCWESVRTKYSDIFELYVKELPSNEKERRIKGVRDYPHKPEELTKEILTTKLKAARTKFHEVSFPPHLFSHSLTLFSPLPLSIFYRLLILDGEVATAGLYSCITSCVQKYRVEALLQSRLV